mmetsp:Transcript_33120/g.60923  ORF Transcript_33120/g.60923 Transcript_33120/m.60923 type:complete len:97 (+) Transcript_33120:163-453(+)
MCSSLFSASRCLRRPADANPSDAIRAMELTKIGKKRPPGTPDFRPRASKLEAIGGEIDRMNAPDEFAMPFAVPRSAPSDARLSHTKTVGKQKPAPI